MDSQNGLEILIVGLGDLGRKIALRLAACSDVGAIILAGQRTETGRSFSRLVAACSHAKVDFVFLNALDSEAVSDLLHARQPDAVVQCAALLSPWLLHERSDAVARSILNAGFAVQLPAQLPIVTSVMRAVRSTGYRGSVVNCSYPDVTHPVLARMGLAPTTGIGNSGMIHNLIRATLSEAPHSGQRLSVVAHHSHVTAAATNTDTQRRGIPAPLIFIDEEPLALKDLLRAQPSLASSIDLNHLTAAHAVETLRALLTDGDEFSTSLPGPLGLPGGWPIRIKSREIQIALPTALSADEVQSFHVRAARGDGIDRIGDDGTVYFTHDAQEAVAGICPELALPLRPDAVIERARVLRHTLTGALQ